VEHTQLLDWLDQSGKILENNPLSEDELRQKLGLTRLQAEKLVELGLSEEVFTYNDHAKLMLTGKI
jgi:hypothetical protein